MSGRTWSGEVARTLRKARRLDQVEVAEVVGVRRQTVSEWENDQRAPMLRHAAAMADLYEVPLDVFFVHDRERDSAQTGRGKPTDGAAAGRRSPVGARQEG